MKYATKFLHVTPGSQRVELVTSTCAISVAPGETYPIGSPAEDVCNALGQRGWSIVAAFPGLLPGSGTLIFERAVYADEDASERKEP